MAGHATSAAPQPRLLGDVGGTHARFGWQAARDAPIEQVRSYDCAAYPGLHDALRAYLRDAGMPAPVHAAIGIANPVSGDHVQMTNRDWSFHIPTLRAALGLQTLRVINDFTALALALPVLRADETRQLFGGKPQPGAPLALIGPGTGLGVSALVPTPTGWVPLAAEGGHVSLSPATAREFAVVQALQRRFGHASAERAVSGPGMAWLYQALCEIDGVAPAAQAQGADAGQWVSRSAQQADADPRCAEAMNLFFAFLGSTAGNLVLSLGALGGVYLGGGILPQLADALRRSPFQESFVAKGRFRAYLQQVPVFLIDTQDPPALRGAAQAL